MAHRIFRNQNGEIKKIAKGFNWWAFLGKWLIYAFLLIVSIWLNLFIEPIVDILKYEKIAVDYWTEKGYKEDINYEII